VDDTGVVWKHGKENLDRLLTCLNNQNENIKFTMEFENNNNIPFLDVLISNKNDGLIYHQVYHKNMHTFRCLHANSHHFPPHYFDVINTLVTQALMISNKEHLEKDIEHL
jgi:hypothetical protein